MRNHSTHGRKTGANRLSHESIKLNPGKPTLQIDGCVVQTGFDTRTVGIKPAVAVSVKQTKTFADRGEIMRLANGTKVRMFGCAAHAVEAEVVHNSRAARIRTLAQRPSKEIVAHLTSGDRVKGNLEKISTLLNDIHNKDS